MYTAEELVRFFSTFSKLPVKIDTIKDHILEKGVVQKIVFHPCEMDKEVIQGLLYYTKTKPPYSSEDMLVANIAHLHERFQSEPMRRLICAKELLHILDSADHAAASKESVVRLVSEIVIPLTAALEMADVSQIGLSDHTGIVPALCLLVPRDARAELSTLYNKGAITIEEIAKVANIPVSYANVVMTPRFEKLQNSF